MLMRMPGSVALYRALPLVPDGLEEPPPETFRLMHWKGPSANNCPSKSGPVISLATYLRVVLGTVLRPGAVETDELVTEHVAARRNRGRDLDVPLIASADELVGGPLARRAVAVNKALLRNLEEVQVAGLGRRAAAGALGEIVDDRAMVALRPGVPLQGDGRAGCDGDLGRAGGRALVAGDVRRAEGVGRDEAVVLVQCEPAGALRLGRGVVPDLGEVSLASKTRACWRRTGSLTPL